MDAVIPAKTLLSHGIGPTGADPPAERVHDSIALDEPFLVVERRNRPGHGCGAIAGHNLNIGRLRSGGRRRHGHGEGICNRPVVAVICRDRDGRRAFGHAGYREGGLVGGDRDARRVGVR